MSRAAAATVSLWLVACGATREPDATVVDVFVSTPSASGRVASAVPLGTVAVEPAATAEDPLENPRRVLLPPTLLPPVATASSLPPPTAAPLAQLNGSALASALAQRAASDAANATPDAPPDAGDFKQGDTLHLSVTLRPGRCYTVIAVSSTVRELDIELTFAPAAGVPFPPTVVAQDAMTGPVAVLGSGTSCFKNPMPMAFPAVAVVRATSGAGTVLAQVFSR